MSAKKFCTTGNTPPPTTIIIKMPDAWAVYLPSPSVAKLKIEAHMTDVNKPQSTSSRAVSGTVVEVNEALDDQPELVNQDAFANWIIKVEISDKGELDNLMDAKAYAAFCEK